MCIYDYTLSQWINSYYFSNPTFIIHDIVFYTNSFPQSSNSSRTWLDELRCLGTESRLINCPANTIGVEDCTHTQDVALVCTASKLDDQIQIYCLASINYI